MNVTVDPIIMWTLGVFPKSLAKRLEELKDQWRIKTMQTYLCLDSFDDWRHLLSLDLHWKRKFDENKETIGNQPENNITQNKANATERVKVLKELFFTGCEEWIDWKVINRNYTEKIPIPRTRLGMNIKTFLMLCLFIAEVIMALHGFLLFIIYNLPWFLGKDSGVVSRYLLHSFEFSFLLLDWLSCKARKPNPLYYLTHSMREKKWIHAFLIGVNVNVAYETRVWTPFVDSSFPASSCYAANTSLILILLIIRYWRFLAPPNIHNCDINRFGPYVYLL